jgi:hypothetical protein
MSARAYHSSSDNWVYLHQGPDVYFDPALDATGRDPVLNPERGSHIYIWAILKERLL